MNDQLPDFEPEQTSEPAAQPPKRRKPMRRKARAPKLHLVTDPPKRRKLLRKLKAKVTKRGRPAGSRNKPKYAPPPATRIPAAASNNTSFAAMMEIVKQVKALPPMDQQEIVQYLKDWL